MKKFSVLLLYPDYMSDDSETFYCFVEAKDRDAAVTAAQEQAWEHNSEYEKGNNDDFLVLLVLPGHVKGL